MDESKYTEIELLLSIAMLISPNSVKDIAAASRIKASSLYKWRTVADYHMSTKKTEALLTYFVEKEPLILIMAEIVKVVLTILLVDSASLTD
jgi:hypothetical protein